MLWALAVRQHGFAVLQCPALVLQHDRSAAGQPVTIQATGGDTAADAGAFFGSLIADIEGQAIYKAVGAMR